ncbi:hypothetical protein D3C72_1406710 [compost metagenome]
MQGGVQGGQHVGRRTRRGIKRIPGTDLQGRVAHFSAGGHGRRRRQTLVRRHCQRVQLARGHMRHDDRTGVHHHIHLLAHSGVDRFATALERHMHNVHAGRQLQQLQAQMRRTGVARRPKVQTPGIGLCVGHESVERGGRHTRPHRQHKRRARHQAHRRERVRVVAELAVNQRVHHLRAHRSHEDRVAVRRRRGRHLGGDDTARAGAVFDDYRLAQGVAHALAHLPRDDIGNAARAERHDQPDGAFRIRGLRAARQTQRYGQRYHHAKNFHAIPLDCAVSALMTQSVL